MLIVDNVSVSINNIKILTNIHLTVLKFTSIIGRNGAGKTTLIKAIMKIRNSAVWKLISTSTPKVDSKNQSSNLYLFW